MFLNDFNGLASKKRLQENFGGIKEWLLKLKEKLGTEADETREMFNTYVRYTQGEATEAEMNTANEQFKDLLRGLGMGTLAALPGSVITLPVVFKLAKKFNIEIMPSAFRAPQDNNPENEAKLHTQYKRNRFKSLNQHRQEEEYLLRQAMRSINNEAANAAQQAAIAIAKKKEQGVTENTSEIKKKISKYEELALVANRAGDDAKCKQYQQKIQSLKQQMSQGVAEGMAGKVVFSGTGANGGKYEIIQSSPTDFMIHANGRHIDTYGSLQRAMSVLKNEVVGLQQGVAEGSSQQFDMGLAKILK